MNFYIWLINRKHETILFTAFNDYIYKTQRYTAVLVVDGWQ